MEKRQLGRTGHMSSVVIFGGAALWNGNPDSANKALDIALESGINHIDVAPQYGLAEELIGPWLEDHRSQFFLGCKTLERERDAAWMQLHISLEKLHTEQLDLYQLHAITDFDELDKAMAKGGAIETLVRARDEGLTRFLGITGHGQNTPAVFLDALERFDFDTIMFPINPVLYADLQYRADAERLLVVCQEREVGVQVIKSIAKQPWRDDPKTYNTWYKPYDVQDKITQNIQFVLSQPGVTAIAAAGDLNLLPMVIEAATAFTPMADATQAALIEAVDARETIFD